MKIIRKLLFNAVVLILFAYIVLRLVVWHVNPGVEFTLPLSEAAANDFQVLVRISSSSETLGDIEKLNVNKARELVQNNSAASFLIPVEMASEAAHIIKTKYSWKYVDLSIGNTENGTQNIKLYLLIGFDAFIYTYSVASSTVVPEHYHQYQDFKTKDVYYK
ncbi:MAG: hypothetical protein HQM10_12315 [Candidatus Riflebacteria bacterium]|nr:hypothetical protein [Candidatus Riflebacteria bacterium]